MRDRDREDQKVNDFLGMSPDEQMEHYGMQQPSSLAMKNDELNPCKECGNRPSIAPNGKVMCIHWNCDRFEKELTHDGWNKYNSTAVPIKEQDVCLECGGIKKKFNDFGLPDKDCHTCKGTGKAPVDKIQEAFEEEEILVEIGLWMIPKYKSSIPKKQMTQILFEGYKSAYKSQQAEIERLKAELEDMRYKLFEILEYAEENEVAGMVEDLLDGWQPKENN